MSQAVPIFLGTIRGFSWRQWEPAGWPRSEPYTFAVRKSVIVTLRRHSLADTLLCCRNISSTDPCAHCYLTGPSGEELQRCDTFRQVWFIARHLCSCLFVWWQILIRWYFTMCQTINSIQNKFLFLCLYTMKFCLLYDTVATFNNHFYFCFSVSIHLSSQTI
jgi:hypothetical protein